MDIHDRPLTLSEVDTLTLPLQNDLIAVFGVIGDEADRLLDKAVREGWTPEQFIDELVRMIEGDNRAQETQAMPETQELEVHKSRIDIAHELGRNVSKLLEVRNARS